MKPIKEFLSELVEIDVKLWTEEDDLCCDAPEEVLTPDILTQLRDRKIEIINFLQNVQFESIPQRPQNDEPLSLSWGQERLWFLNQLEGKSAVYNDPFAVRISGNLDIKALEKALVQILQRHEILRTRFQTENGTPIQVIEPDASINLNLVDLQQLATTQRENSVIEQAQSEAATPFDLENAPLIRCNLLQLSASEYVFLITMHHIVSDGWSLGVFIQELSSLYQAFTQGKEPVLANLPIQYADFAIWQRQNLTSELLEAQLDYWKQELSGVPDLLQLPTDFPRPSVKTYQGSSISFRLNTDLTNKLQSLARESDTTLFMTLYAAFSVLLSRYSGQSDIVIGSPIANRNRSEIEGLIGCFVNTLVLRTQLENNPSFKELLAQVRETTIKAYENQDVPFEQVVEVLQPQRSLSYSPLFQTMFVMQNAPIGNVELPGCTWSKLEGESTIAKFDLTLSIIETDQGLLGKWEYSTDLFKGETIERMTAHLQNLLEVIAENPSQKVGEINLLSESEKHQLLVEWNDSETEYPSDKCIHFLFEEQVEKTPDAVAVVFEDEQLTYQQLNQRANQLAHHLQTLGVKPEVLVGICVERSIEMIVGLLGILKAGGAYVPLDPNYPSERLSYTLRDSDIGILVTQSSLKESLPDHNAQVVCLDSDEIEQQSQDNPDSGVSSDNLAYVIYTSGSTGKPKGVLVEHNNVIRLLKATESWYNFDGNDVWTNFHSIAFDFSVWEIWGALSYGGRLVIVPYWISRDTQSFYELLCQEKVTVLNQTPSAFGQLIEVDQLNNKSAQLNLRLVIFGGEALSLNSLQPWLEKHGDAYPQLVNMYGITETTVHVTYRPIKIADLSIAGSVIGRPIQDLQMYILDNYLQPVPVGVAGEMYVGGAGVTRGYLNRDSLTKERFISNPFTPELEQKLYKTGDLARYLPNGDVEYLGRIDNQVKIRGFRIELGEIEEVLTTHPQVQQAVVIAVEEKTGNKRLVAYIVGQSEITTPQLREHLKAELPGYMVPSAFVILESLPLTANGKVDHKALPAVDIEERDTEYVAPRTEVEQTLTNIWSELLPVNQVSIHDNFFEIGGDSILSIQVISRAKKAGIQITAKQIFQHQTIAELATVVNTTVDSSSDCRQGIVTGVAPLTPIQHLFLEEQTEELHHFNQSVLLKIPHNIEPQLLEKALEKVTEHHDALRLSFNLVESEYQQTNQGIEHKVPLTVIDLSDHSTEEQPQEIERIATEYQGSLNIETGKIIQVVMFNLGQKVEGRLLIIIHHLAVDGVSWRILLEDLENIYQQLINKQPLKLAPKTTAFIDWATKLNNYAQSEIIKQEVDYWVNQLWSETTSLPLDYPDNQQHNTVGSAVNITVKLNTEETSILLGSINEAYNTQINDILLSALSIALREWTRNSKVLIDLEGHGREEILEDVDLSATVGWFTSIFPVLLQVPEDKQIASVIKSVKEQLREIPNRGIGFGILRYLSSPEIAEKIQAIPTPEILFNYLGQFDQVQSETGWKLAQESTGDNQSLKQNREHILDINALVVEGSLQINWTYSSNIHNHNTVENLAENYLQAIRSIVEYCQLEEHRGCTPSDFPLAQLNQVELDELLTPIKTKVSEIYPLSPTQQGMLFHSIYEPESGVYVEQLSMDLAGDINVKAFEIAWQKVVDKYSVLRTFFVWENRKTPLQIVLKEVKLPWQNLDLRSLNLQEQQQQLKHLLQKQKEQSFDFNQAPLMHCTLVRLDDNNYKFIWSHHHILIDGWCLSIIFKDVLSFYEAQLQDVNCKLPASRPYSDYIAWLNAQDKEAATQFWQKTLQGFTAPNPLVVDKTISQSQQNSGDYHEIACALSADCTQKLGTIAQQYRVTLSTIVQAAWALLLSRYSSESDVVFGVSVSGRPPISGVEEMVGLFINTLPLRVKVSSSSHLTSWLQEIQESMVELQQYSYTSLADIQAKSEMGVGISLFESIVVFENYPIDSSLLNQQSSVKVSNIKNFDQTNYPLTIFAVPGDELSVGISYDTARFDEDTMERMNYHLQNLLQGIAKNPDQKLSEITLLSESERHQLLVEWNNTATEYPSDKCIHFLFEKQVEKTPDAVAVVFEDEQLTYQQLNQRANQLAHHLQTLGVKPEMLVGICIEPSMEMIVGLLGILKAGGAYVPLDPNYPPERLSYMLVDSDIGVLVTQSSLSESLPQHKAQVVYVDSVEQCSQENLEVGVRFDNLAYVIYTSGSTGKPKGVQICHQNLVNLCHGISHEYALTYKDRVLQFASISFDVALEEIFPTLLSGATLILRPVGLSLEFEDFSRFIEQEKLSVLNLPAAYWNAWVLDLSQEQGNISRDLRLVIVGSDQVFSETMIAWNKLVGNRVELRNAYGVTEAAITTTVYNPSNSLESLKSKLAPIGKPIANTQVYILDHHLKPLPIGVPGELYLGGAGVARGYLNRLELTKDKFITNPFNNDPSERLYKTGDLARYLSDGNIEFLGRIDNQVKIRGFRIELGEIEAVLKEHHGIEDAVVINNQDKDGNDYLSAYLTLVNNKINIKGTNYRVVTQSQYPSLKEKIEKEHINSWPAFFQGNEATVTYWKKLYEVFPDYQFAVIDNEENIVAAGNTIPLFWNGKESDIPIGWDEAIIQGFDDLDGQVEPNTLCALAGVVNRNMQGQGLSYEAIKMMGKLANAKGLQQFIVPVRPTKKEQYPHVDLKEYVNQTREDGLAIDPWIRVHQKLGGKIIGYAYQSQLVEGSLEQWEQWTGQTFKESGKYVVKGAMQPIDIDIEHKRGTYQDLSVWFQHQVSKYAEQPINILNQSEMRNYLGKHLPEYMVPSSFVILDTLPLTPNGKIDRKALPATDGEIPRNTEYVAARTEVEQVLTNIWSELLPVNKVSIHDNFFEIGGDSILSIQVISRAKNAGIQITTKQIFQHQTIAELAVFANTTVSSSSDCRQGIVTGVAPLTPIQYSFFEEQTEDLHHYNQSVLLKIPHNIKPQLLEKALVKLLEHHDALRLSFNLVESEYQQINQGLDSKVPLTVIDLSEHPIEEQPQAIERIATEYQGSLNLETGQIIQVVMFNLGEKVEGRLLIIIHHLAVDGVSWRILLEDLENIYQQLVNEQPLKLAPKTTAFIDWATKLKNYAQSEIIQQELNYWENQPWLETTSLLLDYWENQQQNTVGSAVNISVKLNAEETNTLLGSISEAYNTQINDILLSALSMSFAEWSDNSKVLIDLEGHGREEIFEDVDLSATIGWFTSLFPVLLQVPEDKQIESVIKSVKEQLRAIPNRGIGFGILRYLSSPEIAEKIKVIPTPEILFNYLGQFDQVQSETGWKLAQESTGDNQSLKHNREHILDINALVVEGELQINWTYSSNIHSHKTVKDLAEKYLKSIRSVIEHCQSEENFGYTPSDFPQAQLDQSELDELLESFE